MIRGTRRILNILKTLRAKKLSLMLSTYLLTRSGAMSLACATTVGYPDASHDQIDVFQAGSYRSRCYCVESYISTS